MTVNILVTPRIPSITVGQLHLYIGSDGSPWELTKAEPELIESSSLETRQRFILHFERASDQSAIQHQSKPLTEILKVEGLNMQLPLLRIEVNQKYRYFRLPHVYSTTESIYVDSMAYAVYRIESAAKLGIISVAYWKILRMRWRVRKLIRRKK